MKQLFSGFFWKFFITITLVFLITVCIFAYFETSNKNKELYGQVFNKLENAALVVSRAVDVENIDLSMEHKSVTSPEYLQTSNKIRKNPAGTRAPCPCQTRRCCAAHVGN